VKSSTWSGDYLRWLADNGYPLAAVEEVVTAAKGSDEVYDEYLAQAGKKEPEGARARVLAPTPRATHHPGTARCVRNSRCDKTEARGGAAGLGCSFSISMAAGAPDDLGFPTFVSRCRKRGLPHELLHSLGRRAIAQR
jgi:hypothetical protein